VADRIDACVRPQDLYFDGMSQKAEETSVETAPVISADGVMKMYGDVVAVDGISFHVRKGELFGLLGPNGAGKTSTIRMLYGFSPMTAGSLRVFGLDVAADWRAIRARIGVCHQENNLDPDLNVWDNLAVFARYHGIQRAEARRRIDDILKFIGMDRRADSPVSALSGGMMRRLVLARALMNEPELVILDEPTTGLDPQSRHLVWERLAELKARGITILLTTHYMDEAARLCDRLIIIDHGRILAEGIPAELVRKYAGHHIVETGPVSDELRKFVASRGLKHEDLGQRIIVYCDEDESLYHEISTKFCMGNCILRIATLEDVFLKLTGRELRE
jgi:lipooligosaccharide transport system ATP-binding protein